MHGTDWLDRLDPERQRREKEEVFGDSCLDREEAEAWLRQVDEEHQRPRNEGRIERNKSDMLSKAWINRTNIIAFDLKGRLINGQHNLAAFVRSGLKEFKVHWGIYRNPNAYIGFDNNAVRRPAHALKWQGMDKAGDIAQVAGVLWQYENGVYRGQGFRNDRGRRAFATIAQIQDVVKHHPGIERHLWPNPFPGSGMMVGAMRAFSYVAHAIDEKRAKEFFEMFIEGIKFQTANDPINVLRKEFIRMRDSGGRERMRNGDTFLRFVKAWNAQLRGETIHGALIRKNDVFEEPISPDDLEPRAPAAKAAVH